MQTFKLDSLAFNKPKNKNITSSFYDHVFQISLLKTNENQSEIEDDPIPIPLFDVLGYHCIPHIGVYGDDYQPFLPLVLIQLSYHDNYKNIPNSLKKYILKDHITDFYIMIHPFPKPSVCQHFLCDETREINLMYHMWTFKDVQFTDNLDVQEHVTMGLFDAFGVKERHQNIENLLAGINIDQANDRIVAIHSSCFSPNNAQILLLEDVEFHHFFAFARYKKRQVITFHVLPSSLKNEALLCQEIEKSKNLKELMNNFLKIQSFHEIAEKIISMIQSV